MKRWFVTGTDTEVGKTVASGALLQAAGAAGYRTAGYKPVASGCEVTAEGLRNSDALALQRYSSVTLPYEQVNPFAFLEPTSPHIVSAEEGRPVSAAALSQGLRQLERQAEWILVEGAGGWYTPLSESLTFADWVRAEQLPVILVVGVKLGCINHALLTADAVRAAGLPLVGWIANTVQPPGKRQSEYLATLKQRLAAPCLGIIPWLTEEAEQARCGHYLRLPE
ncbi:dethiobiotin synthase [[Erwinia] mediterraneensis]|uniref:dethiobiotin synthase n=1 Tax=[Erwinia] mediterraneensis TaxID=2161819 RepID=UPI0010309F3B|nr:dethiobiotin synthase [[Erwinia] mediterraneensis]